MRLCATGPQLAVASEEVRKLRAGGRAMHSLLEEGNAWNLLGCGLMGTTFAMPCEALMAQPNGNNTRARLVVLAAGACGLLVWLGVRGSRWLKGELAYQRWRRQRFHKVTLPHPGPAPAQYVASGRALVWDGRTGREQSP